MTSLKTFELFSPRLYQQLGEFLFSELCKSIALIVDFTPPIALKKPSKKYYDAL